MNQQSQCRGDRFNEKRGYLVQRLNMISEQYSFVPWQDTTAGEVMVLIAARAPSE